MKRGVKALIVILIIAIIKGEDKNGSKSNGRKRKN